MEDRDASQQGNRTISFVDLFSGIGAMRLGFERACSDLRIEPRCDGFSEIDSYAICTYLRHFGGTPSLGDIQTLASIGAGAECDIILAGFPCPAFSLLGKRRGFDDERGQLFFALTKVIQTVRPKAILLENVKGLVSHDGGRTLEVVLETLRSLGYVVWHDILNSRDYGVPQNRPRIYIVGFLKGGEDFQFPKPTDCTKRLRDILETEPVSPQHYVTERSLLTKRLRKARNLAKGNGFGYAMVDPEGVAGTLVCGGMREDANLIVDGRLTVFPLLPRKKSPISQECIRQLTPIECERLQGLPDNFTAGQSDGHRYKQLGNAVTASVIRAIARNLLEAL